MTTSAAADPLVGQVLDRRYRVDRRVGAGGHGVVYAARHVELDAPVALKLVALPEGIDAARRAEHVQRLLSEGRILVRLRHPSIVSALDLGKVDVDGLSTPYLVMEWCDGESLSSVLGARRGAPMSVDEAAAIVETLADALAHAHEAGVAHRDLKPSNVMMTGKAPRLIDFGIAKILEEGLIAGSGRTQTVSPSSPFTPAYAAPEQIVGGRTGPWTDVHALALLFTELVTGKRPYSRHPLPAIGVMDPDRPTPGSFGVDVGPIEAVMAKALSLRPKERHPDAGALQRDLARAVAERRRAPRAAPEMEPRPAPESAPAAPASTAPPASTIDGTALPGAPPSPESAPAVSAITAPSTSTLSQAIPAEAPPRPPVIAPPATTLPQPISPVVSPHSLVPGPPAPTWAQTAPPVSPPRGVSPASNGRRRVRWATGGGLALVVAGTAAYVITTSLGPDTPAAGPTAGPVATAHSTAASRRPGAPAASAIAENDGPMMLTRVPLVAKRLSELSRAEFETRVAKSGWGLTLLQRRAGWVSISMNKGLLTRTITWVPLPDSAAAASYGSYILRDAAYAVDGTVAVYGYTTPNMGESKALLEEVLAGLGARIQSAPGPATTPATPVPP